MCERGQKRRAKWFQRADWNPFMTSQRARLQNWNKKQHSLTHAGQKQQRRSWAGQKWLKESWQNRNYSCGHMMRRNIFCSKLKKKSSVLPRRHHVWNQKGRAEGKFYTSSQQRHNQSAEERGKQTNKKSNELLEVEWWWNSALSLDATMWPKSAASAWSTGTGHKRISMWI